MSAKYAPKKNQDIKKEPEIQVSPLKKYMSVIVLGVIALLLFFGSFFTDNLYAGNLSAKQAEYTEKQNTLEQGRFKKQEITKELLKDVTGLDGERLSSDYKTISDLMRRMSSWSSYAEYETMRQEVMNEYGLSEDLPFVKAMIPKIIEAVTPDGTRYNRIDLLGYNLNFEGVDVRVADIKDGIYSYVTFARISTNSENGGEAAGDVIFLCKSQPDGSLTDLQAYVVAP